MIRPIAFCAATAVMGFIAAEAYDHIQPTMWGWVWELRPAPDFHGTQLVECPDGSLTFPPWHVLVLYSQGMGFGAFLQERGR